MSPLTIYSPQGLPKLPTGPQGPAGAPGVPGPAGPQGPAGTPAPTRLTWQAFGDNSGDGANSSNTTFSTVKSPVITVPSAGWFRLHAEANAFPDTNGASFDIALMTDATAVRLRRATANSGWFTAVSILVVAQIAAGTKIMIGYRPTTAGRTITFVNSGNVIPLLEVIETSAPS